jgi:GrpB-like predicted nucleotidyltransferase (UPF0157 family)
MSAAPIVLWDVAEVAARAEQVVAGFEADIAMLLPAVEVHHIGATAMGFGHTKGDVDVNVRVGEETFDEVVDVLRQHFEVAQPHNWTPTYASFASGRYALPLGVQVTVIGSSDDFLLTLRDRLRDEPELLRQYDKRKLRAAPHGHHAYSEAKHDFLRELVPRDWG